MPAPWRNTTSGSARPTDLAAGRREDALAVDDELHGVTAALRGAQRLAEIVDQVAGILEPDREPDHAPRRRPPRLERRGIHLLMRGAGRMDHQRLGVADIGEVREQRSASMKRRPAGARP
jgi:hypothetical protein